MIPLYSFPRQNQENFDHFLLSLENSLGNIRNKDSAFTILLGGLNARSKSWWVHDITNIEGTQMESISSLYEFSRLIPQNPHTSPKIHYPALTSFLKINPTL